MRFLLKLSSPIKAGNNALSDPQFGAKMQKYLQDIKAETAYFTLVDGHRGGYIVVNIDDPSQIPALAEPLFFWQEASLELIPVMLPEDLAKSGPAIEAAVKEWK